MEHSVTGFDMGQKRVPETLSLGGTFDETRDVHHIKESRDFAEKESREINTYTQAMFYWLKS